MVKLIINNNLFLKNGIFIVLLVLVSGVVYFNILDNEFMVVDDLSSFVNYEPIRDLSASLKFGAIQRVVYAFSYHFWGINPLPLQVISLGLHITGTILAFATINKLFGQRVTQIAALLFAAHPVNTEAVTWISGSAHLYNSLFGYLTIIAYITYKQSQKKWWLAISILIFIIDLIFVRSPWVFVIPPVLVIIDQFILEKKFNWKSLLVLMVFFLSLALFYFVYLQKYHVQRLESREDGSQVAMNQQLLTPLWESGAYTIFMMFKLYAFPKDLTMYYDGQPISTPTYVSMWLSLATYLGLVAYFFKVNRRIAGLLILLPVYLAPTFSPVKITWFMAERYLYFGGIFFTTLVAMWILKLEKATKIKYLAYGITGVLVVALGARTIVRNNDWQNPKTLAFATIKTAPMSVRPYNDLGGAYALEKNWTEAIKYYEQALTIGNSGTAINNLGYIYLQTGLPSLKHEPKSDFEINQSKWEQVNSQYQQAIKLQQTRAAIYYLNQALQINPLAEDVWLAGVELYLQEKKYSLAEEMLQKLLQINNQNAQAWFWRAFVTYKTNQIVLAREYLQKTLAIDPQHQDAKKNLEMINKSL